MGKNVRRLTYVMFTYGFTLQRSDLDTGWRSFPPYALKTQLTYTCLGHHDLITSIAVTGLLL